MANYKILSAADSVTETLQFDVIRTATGDVVKSGGVPVSPSVDMIGMPTGIGFKQTLEIVNGDTIDYIVRQTINKKNISLVLYWSGNNAYQKWQSFGSWLALYLDLTQYHIRLSYQVGNARRYVEVSPIDFDLIGRDLNDVSAKLTLQPITPFYEEGETSFQIITNSNTGKIYNYQYPYAYGGGAYSDSNVIKNDYLKDLPLKVILKGPMAAPFVAISTINEDDQVESQPYLRVSFEDGFSIDSNEEVVIDAFNIKIYKNHYTLDAYGNKVLEYSTDCLQSVNKLYNSFLFAKPGRSRVSCSLDSEASACTVAYVRYVI